MSSQTETGTHATPGAPRPGLWQRLSAWSTRHGMGNKLALLLTVASIGAGAATYAALTESPPFGKDPNTVTLLLTLDLALLLLLVSVMARRIIGLWIERRQGMAGARLHVRLVAVFSLLAVFPAIIMATFSALFFYVGVQTWFSDRVRTAINESLAVAEAYVKEHQNTIRTDILEVQNDLELTQKRLNPWLMWDPIQLRTRLMQFSLARSLTELVVLDGTGRVYAQVALGLKSDPKALPPARFDQARQGEVVVVVNESEDRVTALVYLDSELDTFLYATRPVEPRVLAHMEQTQKAVNEYSQLEGQRFGLQTQLAMIFVVVALLLLLAAIWVGLNFASFLVHPISNLIGAAERVRAGDLTARVPENTSAQEDELTSLSKAFNRMTSQLESQRAELVEANRQLDLRRRFTEAVLAGVSAGVLGLDQNGVINLPNLSAAELLGVPDPAMLVGRPIIDIAPEIGELMSTIRRRPSKLVEHQVQIRRGSAARTLLVRVAAEVVQGEIRGFVVTFDDVSELLSAQRKAAWADVARRIAHEIKNPLTPIQLSAERLRRKYGKEIQSDPETFRQMTDTIVRHVDDIGRMVDEFSAFARMPAPVMKPQGLQEMIRQAVFLQSTAQTAIRFETVLPDEKLVAVCDGRLISQALTNLLKNAVEAIEGRAEEAGSVAPPPPGHIVVRLTGDEERASIAVEDNGKGLPHDERDRLTEPYVTTRAKGTGLGLAIVKKIMEDHGGALVLDDNPGGGARVTLVLPWTQAAADANTPAADIDARQATPQAATAGRG
ncbi:MAG TPA: PAS domain-containing sensor histidine kinase [Azospirillaceae bacterium]|nr:PAS domain-containing sensor histidine kinase [Azospirillaceae bacterium]